MVPHSGPKCRPRIRAWGRGASEACTPVAVLAQRRAVRTPTAPQSEAMADAMSTTSAILVGSEDLALSHERDPDKADETPAEQASPEESPSEPPAERFVCKMPICPFCALNMENHNDYKALAKRRLEVLAELVGSPGDLRGPLESFALHAAGCAEYMLDSRGLIPATEPRMAMHIPRTAVPKPPAPAPPPVNRSGAASSSAAAAPELPAACATPASTAGVWADPDTAVYVASSLPEPEATPDEPVPTEKKKNKSKKVPGTPELEAFTEQEWLEYEAEHPRINRRWNAAYAVKYLAGPNQGWQPCAKSAELVEMYFSGVRRGECWQMDASGTNRRYDIWWLGDTDGVQYNDHSRMSRSLKIMEVEVPTPAPQPRQEWGGASWGSKSWWHS